MSKPRLYTTAARVRVSDRGLTVHLLDTDTDSTCRTVCGIVRPSSTVWNADGREVTCRRCLTVATCARGHELCGTPELCAQLADSKPSLSLTALQSAAHEQGISAGIMGTGGNVVAMALTVGGVSALLSLDDGAMVGTTWTIGLDAEDRERFGELESTAPVTSDADQTIADAAAWVWHIVYGNPLADGDTPAIWPSHGARVVHRNGDTGTAVGDQRSNDPRYDDGVIVIGVVWDTDPEYVETYPIDALNRPTR